jgi:pimeloyl-ACP methyl ester carboxylesterase
MLPATITNPWGERLAFSFTPGAAERRDLVVLGHGLTSDKERPWSEGLAEALRRQGIASVRIAFSGNGESEGEFVESNITKEVADLGAVLDAFDGWRSSYVGHSMGGAVGLLRASTDRRIRTLVSLSAVTHAAEFMRDMFVHLRPGDPILDKPHCPFSAELRADLLSLGSLTSVAGEVSVPWLVVHGTNDEIVPSRHSVDLNAAAAGRSELVLLEGVDHTFGEDGLERMLEVVTPWLCERLNAERGYGS